MTAIVHVCGEPRRRRIAALGGGRPARRGRDRPRRGRPPGEGAAARGDRRDRPDRGAADSSTARVAGSGLGHGHDPRGHRGERALCERRFTALADASAIVGSHATRANGTIGGNVMNASPAMDTGGPLLCFGATVILRSAAGERRWRSTSCGRARARRRPLRTSCSWRSTCRRPPPARARLRPPRVPAPDGDRGRRRDRGGHARGRRPERSAGRDHGARADDPSRRPRPRGRSSGGDGARCDVAAAARAAAAAAAPISDVRASADYRSAMAEVVARRAITAALTRARGGEVPIPASDALYGA